MGKDVGGTEDRLMIRIKNFSFRFKGSERNVLDNVSLNINPGEFIVVTGPSGCGKSTLSLCISGFSSELGTAQGSIDVDGKDVVGGNVFESSALVGIVQQDPESQLVALTVEEEVAFGPENLNLPKNDIEDRMEWGLRMARALHLRDRATFELSGGEKQKVALASMLAMRPKVLIFDEPTSNLDPVATKEIFDSIIALKRETDMTIIVMEHKLHSLLDYADTLILMDDGRIVEKGRPSEILSKDNIKEYGIEVPHSDGHRSRCAIKRDGDVILRMEGLEFSYGNRKVLDDVCFEARKGEMICLMGENGSGKTTFLYMALGLLRPNKGRVKVFDTDIKRTSISTNARNVGLIFQNPNHQIFEDTVQGELEFAANNFNMDVPDTDELLERFRLPVGKGTRPFKLSFGQKRRLNIASICSYGPKIILLDEPFIGQDFRNASNLMNILEELKGSENLIMFVSHDPRMISKYCTRIVFFEDGRIKYDDGPEEVFKMMEADGKTEFLPRHMVMGI